tara:strand:+ start:919 stop:1182 length:264 start_codon:yes stop_codon:yes gene_type:complete
MGYPGSINEVHYGAINTTLTAPTGKSFKKFIVSVAGTYGVTSPMLYVNGTLDNNGYNMVLVAGQEVEGEFTAIGVPNTTGANVVAYI